MPKECLEGEIVFSNGFVLCIGALRQSGFLVKAHVAGLFVLLLVFCIIINPFKDFWQIPSWERFGLFLIIHLIAFLVYIMSLTLMMRSCAPGSRISTMICISLAAATIAGLEFILIDKGWHQESIENILTALIFHFWLISVAELYFVSYALPNHTKYKDGNDKPNSVLVARTSVQRECKAEYDEARSNQDDTGAESAQYVSLRGRNIPVKSIRYVTAHEHYLSIAMYGEANIFMRARLKDFLVQVPEALGYFIHRSHWVSWESISDVIKTPHTAHVVLDDETQLPIARGRRADFCELWQRKLVEFSRLQK